MMSGIKMVFAGVMSLVAVLGLPTVAFGNEVEEAKRLLQEQITLLNQIESYVERHDLGRLRMLRRSSEATLGLIEERGLAHNETFQSYNVLIITYTNSTFYFDSIETVVSSPWIERVQDIVDDIIEDRGLPAASRIIAIYFSEMKERFDDLLDLDIPATLRLQVEGLTADFGDVLALANARGDVPPTFDAATALYLKVEALYPDFHEIADSEPAFMIVTDIIGLAEFYREYSE